MAAACGEEAAAPPSTTAPPPTEYEATATVLDDGGGPELCLGGVEDSLPPQCGGPALLGWDWAAVDGEESASGTTWGDYHVVGTWDGEALTLTEPPGPPEWGEAPDLPFIQACASPTGDPARGQLDSPGFGDIPDLVRAYSTHPPYVMNLLVRPGAAEAATAAARERWDGLLCVAERDEPTEAELRHAQSEVLALQGEGGPLGDQLGSGIYGLDPFVHVEVLVLTDELQAYAEERWGDLVQLNGALQPVVDG